MTGERFTIADIPAAFAASSFGVAMINLAVEPSLTQPKAWIDSVAARPSAKA